MGGALLSSAFGGIFACVVALVSPEFVATLFSTSASAEGHSIVRYAAAVGMIWVSSWARQSWPFRFCSSRSSTSPPLSGRRLTHRADREVTPSKEPADRRPRHQMLILGLVKVRLFVRILVTLAFLEVGMMGFVAANPIVIDSIGDSISLVSESVDVGCGEIRSAVSGTYSFRQIKGDWPIHDSPILIQVPIILHAPQSLASVKASTGASVSIGRRAFHPTGVTVESSYDLPSGWKFHYLEFEIPHRIAGPVFTIAIRYIQPHLPGSLAPYYPIHPPDRFASKCIVHYSIPEPASLTLVSKNEKIIGTQRTQLTIRPQHHQLILVRVNKA